jgi:hypothetical protein
LPVKARGFRIGLLVVSNERFYSGVAGKTENSVAHVQTGLNKDETKNALARTVFFNRLDEIVV